MVVRIAVLMLAAVTALAAAPPVAPAAKRLTVAATGDLLIHRPVWQRALAHGHGRRYDFRPMFRPIRRRIVGADLALCHVETPLVAGPPPGVPPASSEWFEAVLQASQPV